MSSVDRRPAPHGTAFVLGLYTLTIFLSAALLFLVQPMFARMVLPRLGGSPAVWNTAVVFYQAALLAGYAYAYFSSRALSPRAQVLVHFLLLAIPFAVLPLGIPDAWTPNPDHPAASLLAVLAVAVGLPFVVVSTTAPLLQRWFSASGHPHGRDPYFLYASSNAGSLLALLGYPVAMERWLPLGEQARWWTFGYAAFVVLCAGCGVLILKARGANMGGAPDASPAVVPDDPPAGRPALARQMRWLALAAVPVSLMLSVTTYLTTDLSAVPLLWVIPLAVYLVTFVLTFARRPPVPPRAVSAVVPFVLAGLMFLIAAKEESTDWWLVASHVAAFFVIALACHGRLASLRPGPGELTRFYLIVSLGGALGGMFNALAAPLLFEHVYEYPLSLILAAALLMPAKPAAAPEKGTPRREGRAVPKADGRGRSKDVPAAPATASRRGWIDLVVPAAAGAVSAIVVLTLQAPDHPSSWLARGLMFGAPLAAGLAFGRRRAAFALTLGAVFAASTLYGAGRGTLLLVDRTFYGINRVVLQPSGRYRVLGHGNTTHGAQSLDPAREREPLTYFHPNGPLGQIFAVFNTAHPQGRVGVVGLGTGSIACYRTPAQRWTFYELDPAVVEIARDTGLFTFLRLCAPDARIVTGDARLSLQSAAAGEYDLLVLDAYSSDAIPIHLITREAIALYMEKLAPGGLLAFNISNRHLDLGRVLAGISAELGLAYRKKDDLHIDPRLAGRGMMPSQWAVIARDAGAVGAIADDATWTTPAADPLAPVWTDDFNNLLSVFRW
ncbi:MAG: fused MFS/spermidine synthase [Acidobacteria bacterium]|nr:fused MFS/spermidine synthase [Acidobacteriota bacterium]